MKITREKTENSQAFLTIEMEAAEVEEYLEKSYHRMVSKANIPGFRAGCMDSMSYFSHQLDSRCSTDNSSVAMDIVAK